MCKTISALHGYDGHVLVDGAYTHRKVPGGEGSN